MLAIRLPEALEERLARLAQATGMTKTSLEDLLLAQARARRNRKTIPMEELERELGLAD
jgi:RHH-type rel operon transcriptional repressor/antitoxin RelB